MLWPARESAAQLAEQRALLGSYGFAGQYQQRPVPHGGGLFKREWFRYYDAPPPAFDRVTQSWDLTFKGQETHDWVVGLVIGQVGTDYYVVERYKAHAAFTETCHAMAEMSQRFPDTSAVLVEDTANGPAVLDSLRGRVPALIPVSPDGGKYARASAVSPLVEAGHVWVPNPVDAAGRMRPAYAWVPEFLDVLTSFPLGDSDDDVDALTQLLRWVQGQHHAMLEYLKRLKVRDQARRSARTRVPARVVVTMCTTAIGSFASETRISGRSRVAIAVVLGWRTTKSAISVSLGSGAHERRRAKAEGDRPRVCPSKYPLVAAGARARVGSQRLALTAARAHRTRSRRRRGRAPPRARPGGAARARAPSAAGTPRSESRCCAARRRRLRTIGAPSGRARRTAPGDPSAAPSASRRPNGDRRPAPTAAVAAQGRGDPRCASASLSRHHASPIIRPSRIVSMGVQS